MLAFYEIKSLQQKQLYYKIDTDIFIKVPHIYLIRVKCCWIMHLPSTHFFFLFHPNKKMERQRKRKTYSKHRIEAVFSLYCLSILHPRILTHPHTCLVKWRQNNLLDNLPLNNVSGSTLLLDVVLRYIYLRVIIYLSWKWDEFRVEYRFVLYSSVQNNGHRVNVTVKYPPHHCQYHFNFNWNFSIQWSIQYLANK